jgi:hypothetical protein
MTWRAPLACWTALSLGRPLGAWLGRACCPALRCDLSLRSWCALCLTGDMGRLACARGLVQSARAVRVVAAAREAEGMHTTSQTFSLHQRTACSAPHTFRSTTCFSTHPSGAARNLRRAHCLNHEPAAHELHSTMRHKPSPHRSMCCVRAPVSPASLAKPCYTPSAL